MEAYMIKSDHKFVLRKTHKIDRLWTHRQSWSGMNSRCGNIWFNLGAHWSRRETRRRLAKKCDQNYCIRSTTASDFWLVYLCKSDSSIFSMQTHKITSCLDKLIKYVRKVKQVVQCDMVFNSISIYIAPGHPCALLCVVNFLCELRIESTMLISYECDHIQLVQAASIWTG